MENRLTASTTAPAIMPRTTIARTTLSTSGPIRGTRGRIITVRVTIIGTIITNTIGRRRVLTSFCRRRGCCCRPFYGRTTRSLHGMTD